ncbi:MAG: hypothetical protein JWM90_1883 [Thermoleophilia bacterium]|nr:hypothetical protein [Thermoleophilia bacterium]
MSFLDYLKEHRGQFIDHRAAPPTRPSISAADLDVIGFDGPAGVPQQAQGGGPGGALTRRRRARTTARSIRFRHVQPVFTRSAYSDPLPYEETWERAFR